MKISYNWLKNISLIFSLILLPLKSVYADGRDHSYENLAAISMILMVTVVSIIFAFIFARGKDFLTKVITFCIVLVLIWFSVLFFGVYLIFVLVAVAMYAYIRFPSLSLQEKKYVRKLVLIFIFLLLIILLSIIQSSIIN
ncbi:MAG: hypothetical protein KAU07_03065 [Candidatus Andersenbacteria bacterium]|nr:hypothetical protein [Candidatus Andersenbacteria bacterium]